MKINKLILGLAFIIGISIPAFAFALSQVLFTGTNPQAPSVLIFNQPLIMNMNPLFNKTMYVDPNSNARRQANEWRTSRPADAALMDKIANAPQSRWFGGWNANIYQDVNDYVSAASSTGAFPVLVAYNIPQRDCGGYSAGGSGSEEAYKNWINEFARGIGNRNAVVILEPDAIPQITCLPIEDQNRRFSLLNYAVETFKKNQNALVYIDAGHSKWISAEIMAPNLLRAGLAKADGFSLNVSNFQTTVDNILYGELVSALTNNKHFVIDTSRNGLGSNGEWCNPSGRALGVMPSTNTGHPLVDAYLWIKTPGESDGNCNGGPNAGVWWPDYALGLAKRVVW
jgi:endoglucanase